MVRRRPSRRHERGASVFIVLLVITLLTAIGIFSARSASLVDQAAGFDRQLVQTQYLTEFAGRAVSAELGDGAAKSYLDKIRQGTDKCEANKNVAPVPGMPIACYKLYVSEIADRVNAKTGTTLIEKQTVANSGSLGPKLGVAGLGSASEGVFVVEMTEPFETVPNPGSEVGGQQNNAFRDVQVTLTAMGQVRPLDVGGGGADPWCAVNASSTAASVAALRAHVTLKNVHR
ncbi:MAG: hypothetical protein R3B13_24580 [Polyangiaceae bacterium]